MEDNKELQAQATENEKVETSEEKQKKAEEAVAILKKTAEEMKRRDKEASEAMKAGKGVFTLEIPILARDEEIKELKYDFTSLTGLEYIDAMDADGNAKQIYRITYRQALALFAKAAAKETEWVDWRDIMERISAQDATAVVQLATIFFTGSTRAGQMRISKMS